MHVNGEGNDDDGPSAIHLHLHNQRGLQGNQCCTDCRKGIRHVVVDEIIGDDRYNLSARLGWGAINTSTLG